MCWIQFSNHFVFCWVHIFPIQYMSFFILEPWLCHCCRVTSLLCLSAYKLLKEGGFQQFCCTDHPILKYHFYFWLSQSYSNTKQYVFFILEPWCCHHCKITWKLLSFVLVHMNDWKRVVSNHFEVLNPIIKSSGWRDLLQYVFHSWTMIL